MPPDPIHRRAERLIEQQSLDILIFGPGRRSEAGWRFRMLIKEHLSSLARNDTIAFPEEVVAESETLRLVAETHLFVAELAVMMSCDVAVALIVDDPFASGVLVELGQFLTRPRFVNRFVVVMPEHLRDLALGSTSPYAFHAIRRLAPSQILTYSPAGMDRPVEVLAALQAWLDAVRALRLLDDR